MHILNGVLTKSAFSAVRVLTVFFGAGLIATAFAGSPAIRRRRFKRCDGDVYANLTTYSLVSYPGLYRSYGGELGLRYFFFSKEMSQPWRIRPYISVSGGATHVDHIGDVLYQSSNGFYSYAPFIKGRLYNDSWVGTGAFLVGAEVPLSCHWSVCLDAGIRYESPLDPSSDITHYNYCRIPYQVSDQHYNHDAGDRLYVP